MNRSPRYDRQERIEGWRQANLSQACVLVAGAGALGNEVIKNLALVGVGQILIVDDDRIELSNLSRTVLFRPADIGRSKARTAARAASRLNPEIKIRAVHGNLFYDLGLGFCRHGTLIIGCLDNNAARMRLSHMAMLAGAPFLDGGMWAMGGEVRWFEPSTGPCFECTLSDQARQDAAKRWSCTGYKRHLNAPPEPAATGTTAVIAGLMVQEAIQFLCGWPIEPGAAIVYNGLKRSLHTAALSRNPLCNHHHTYRDVVELPGRATTQTARNLLKTHGAETIDEPVLALGRDFLLKFHCRICKKDQAVAEPLGKVDESRAQCPQCGRTREPEIIFELNPTHELAAQALHDLGVPHGEILAVRTCETMRLYELTGDIHHIWQ